MLVRYLTVALLILPLLFEQVAYATEACSRTAIINYQEVLVDPSSTQKGEGLRFYLEKDPIAKDYLNRYRKGTQIDWRNATLGVLGTFAILSALLVRGTSKNQQSLLVVGGTLMTLNFLVARTLAFKNEENLHRAIEEYNKRNLPRIHFNPFSNNSGNRRPSGLGMISINFTKEF